MTRACYLDCFSGVSGNMMLGAVIDAGVNPRWLRPQIKKVISDFQLLVKEDVRSNIGGTHVKVKFKKEGQPHRGLNDILKMIDKSGLNPDIIKNSKKVFRKLAEAEAKVHRIPANKVHFHEVGAVDAIVDVVGSVAGLHKLGADEIICSALPVTAGEVCCCHGTLPLPAPAVMELVKGVPVKGLPGETELVTPTGAALAVTLSMYFGPMPSMIIKEVGTGLGDRDIAGRPNIMRVVVGEKMTRGDVSIQLETVIDDMVPEHFDLLMDRLHEAGALEVVLVPSQMKKNRPGTLVRVLSAPENRDQVVEEIFNNSTTLGIREFEVNRTVLDRKIISVKTAYGNIKVKLAMRPDGTVRTHPENDDVKKAAEKNKVSMEKVSRAARHAAAKINKDKKK
jgi:pyridinium-3,5-bisthiocarboxylic acid mononucleotide nickel chelatase